MVMDARWKVYVQDRRFDDNQISNMYLKLKWETVGRFSFDFRPMDGDESYMVANNTLRIFWGDLHKLDGVIQRVEWDAQQWCYHIYGADIRGLLLERVNTTPATVHSYTSDIQTNVMFDGCDFPTNIWTGSGENIGKYTFNYRIGILNTIHITSPTIMWGNVVERGTVTATDTVYIEDATKSWEDGIFEGNYIRFVTGACKNKIYNIITNTESKIFISLSPSTSETCTRYTHGPDYIYNGSFDYGDDGWWYARTTGYWPHTIAGTGWGTGGCSYYRLKGYVIGYFDTVWAITTTTNTVGVSVPLAFRYKYKAISVAGSGAAKRIVTSLSPYVLVNISGTSNTSYPDWDTVYANVSVSASNMFELGISIQDPNDEYELWIDDVRLGYLYYNILNNGNFESATIDPWGTVLSNTSQTVVVWGSDAYAGSKCVKLHGQASSAVAVYNYITQPIPLVHSGDVLGFWYKTTTATVPAGGSVTIIVRSYTGSAYRNHFTVRIPNGGVSDWTYVSGALTGPKSVLYIGVESRGAGANVDLLIDDIQLKTATTMQPVHCNANIPSCIGVGDIYEIATPKYVQIYPQPTATATLEKNVHMIRFNDVDDLSEHTTSITVRGVA